MKHAFFHGAATVCAQAGNRYAPALLALGLLWSASGAWAELPPPLPSGDAAMLRKAFQAEDAGRWADAIAMTGQIYDPVARKLVLWRAYTENNQPNDSSVLAAFIDANPNWPGRNALLAQAEKALYQERDGRDPSGWLARHPPTSGLGRVLQAETLMARRHTQEGVALLRKSWVEDGYPSDIEPDLLARFRSYLRPDDFAARTSRLLWDRNLNGAARMLPYLDSAHQILAEVRMNLIQQAPSAAQALGTVPANLRTDPGLLFDQVRWRRRSGMADSAMDLLKTITGPTLSGDYAGQWWTERNALVRAALKDRDYRSAYQLASGHGQKYGADFAEAEWLSGWIAFRLLNDPVRGYTHFTAMYNSVSKPISLARGAYWAGRAAQASGRTADAQSWYEEGSRYQTTFYGQLAAQAAGVTMARPLPPDPAPSAADRRRFAESELARATRILADQGRDRYVRMFATRMVEDVGKRTDWVLIGRFFRELDRPDLEVWVGRQASYRHIILPSIAYPSIALPAAVTSDRALVHGVSRQESAFYTRAVSPSGARGLMQLMPATAQSVAQQLGMSYSLPRLTADPAYNATLGSAYLQKMLDRFGGAYVLAIAAYNAGPGRVGQWLGTYGDPRTGQIDMIDWIEMIPINETRNYVQRVLENTQIYRQILAGGGAPVRTRHDIYRGASAEPEPATGRRVRAPS